MSDTNSILAEGLQHPLIEAQPGGGKSKADRRRRMALGWATGAVTLVAGTALFAFLVAGFTRRAMKPPRRPRRDDRLDGLPVEEVKFHAWDETPLRGWFIPAAEPRGVIICCHGYLGNRGTTVPHARFLREAGYSCLAFDFRGAGESAEGICTFGYREADDVRGAIRYLRERRDTAHLPMGGLGLSMGGVALLLAAPKEPDLRAIVADGVYPSLAQAIRRRCDLLFGPMSGLAQPIVNGVVRRHIGAHPEDVSPIGIAASLDDRPTLFMHADRDIYVDVEHAEAFLARALEPKALRRVASAMHCRGVQEDPAGYSREVVTFFRSNGL